MLRLLVALLFVFQPAFAEDEEPLLFGPEFTFEIPEYMNTGVALDILGQHMHSHLVDNQPEEIKFRTMGIKEFFSPEGWSLAIQTDHGVIESQLNPMTVEDNKSFADNIQDALFVSAANNGYFPAPYMGGGHINISGKYFADKPLLFRNFFVDLLNHSELFLGIWNYDTNNALSYALMSKKSWEFLRKAIDDFDNSDMSLKELRILSSRIGVHFVGLNDAYWRFWKENKTTRQKNTAINFSHISQFSKKVSRLEIRGFRPQASMDVYVRQIQLLQGRIHYLKKYQEPIPLKPNFIKYSSDDTETKVSRNEALNPPVNPQWALNEYYWYVLQAGEKWEDHQDYLWPSWIQSGELKKFNEFLDSCDQLFSKMAP